MYLGDNNQFQTNFKHYHVNSFCRLTLFKPTGSKMLEGLNMLWNLVVSVERRFKHARTGLICFGQCFSGSYCNLMKQRRQAWKEKSITGGLDRAVNKAAKAGPCAPSSSLWRCRNALHACTTARPIRSSITADSSIPSRHPPFYSTCKHKTLLNFFPTKVHFELSQEGCTMFWFRGSLL
jgi:hypothetical protein